ncbi:MAG: beta-lactamase family protein [Algicola sp.]|nr:beta-lactamase family protein [Algicola sp.]
MVEQKRQIDALIRRYFADPDSPGGSVIVIKQGEVFFQASYGLADMEHAVKNTPDTVFKMASITKEFTAVAVLMLIHEGKVTLQDPICKHVPYYYDISKEDKNTKENKNKSAISIEHLLTHTSGIIDTWDFSHRDDMTVEQMIDLFKDQPLGFKPGEADYYSNSGYKLLGAMIENLSGISYGEFIESRIFKPLGMNNSHFGNDRKIVKNSARGYSQTKKGYANAEFISMALPYAAGSLISTVKDMAKFNAALYGDILVPQALLQRAWTEYFLPNGESTNGGYGWRLSYYKGRKMIGGGGCIHGFRCMDIRVPEEQVYVMIFSNQERHSMIPEAMKIAAITMSEPMVEPPVFNLSEHQLADYVGKYHFEDDSYRQVIVEGGVLKTLREESYKVEVRPYAIDKFIDYEGTHDMIFERDDSGTVITAFIGPREGFLGGSGKGVRVE